MSAPEEILLDKIRSLPPEKISEVEHFVDSLARRRTPDELHEAIAAYAAAHAGGPADLDRDFEAAAVEHWLNVEDQRHETR